jgi:putative phage repressor
MMDIKERIKQFADSKGIPIYKFESTAGLSNGYVNGIRKGIGSEKLSDILRAFPELNRNWLLFGEGEMLRTGAPAEASVSEDAPPPQLIPAPPGKGLPLIPLPAMAGFLKGAADIDPNEIEWYFVPAFRDCQFLIRVKGESMSPRYLSGDIVACREVQDTGTFFQWGKTYVLDTDQGVVIKRVRPSEKENHILCVSDNPEYDPFDVPIAGIYHLAIVRGLIREE